MHILSPETGNCPSWISGRESVTVKIFHDQSPRKNVAYPMGAEPATSWSPVGTILRYPASRSVGIKRFGLPAWMHSLVRTVVVRVCNTGPSTTLQFKYSSICINAVFWSCIKYVSENCVPLRHQKMRLRAIRAEQPDKPYNLIGSYMYTDVIFSI